MDQMDFEQEPSRIADVTVLRLTGPFTLTSMFDFQDTLRQPALTNVIIDLTGVPYIDSAALGVILAHYAHTQRAGHRFALAGMSSRVMKIFELTRVDKVLAIFDTREEAEDSFTSK